VRRAAEWYRAQSQPDSYSNYFNAFAARLIALSGTFLRAGTVATVRSGKISRSSRTDGGASLNIPITFTTGGPPYGRRRTSRSAPWAAWNGYDLVVEMDADFSHHPEDVPRLILTGNVTGHLCPGRDVRTLDPAGPLTCVDVLHARNRASSDGLPSMLVRRFYHVKRIGPRVAGKALESRVSTMDQWMGPGAMPTGG
jgi:hypothetical protein